MADETRLPVEHASRETQHSHGNAAARMAKWISVGAAAVEAVTIVFMYFRSLESGPPDKAMGDALGFVAVMLPALFIGFVSAALARPQRSWLMLLHLALTAIGVVVFISME